MNHFNQLSSRLSVAIILAFFLASPLYAHPSGDHTHDDHAQDHHAHENGHAVLLPQLEGPAPWSDAPVLNDPERFHIAIMTDRTGGHRPGVWMKGVRAVNLLRPEFVVSVGDLIEGYTEDRERVQAEWTEFLGFIDQMEMKFFFVAGNHDVTNPMMHDLWRKHFGPEWYSFDYKNVHFVCLSTEDPLASLSEKQLAWVRDDLKQHEDARWTLIFLHKPLWAMSDREKAAGNPDHTGWTELEQMLGSRPHTCFAGHVHHYVQYDRNGKKILPPSNHRRRLPATRHSLWRVRPCDVAHDGKGWASCCQLTARRHLARKCCDPKKHHAFSQFSWQDSYRSCSYLGDAQSWIFAWSNQSALNQPF